jgi:hypothetical protein
VREFLSADHIANQIRMQRTRWSGAFLLVEGDLDSRFYSRFVLQSSIVVAHGKDRAIGALRILVDEGFKGILAIVDQDFWVLGEGSRPDLAGLLCTDGRDLEIMLLRSPVLERLLTTWGSKEKLGGLRERDVDPADILLQAGKEIGYLRWLSERDRSAPTRTPDTALSPDGPLRLKFRELTFGKFVDRRALRIDLQKLIQAVSNHSQQPIYRERVEVALQALRSKADERRHDAWDICAGHDLLKLLEIGLCSLFGSCQPSDLKNFDRVLVVAYDDEWFWQSALFANLQAWQAANPEQPLLRADRGLV